MSLSFYFSQIWSDDANDDIHFDKSAEFVMKRKWRSVKDSVETEKQYQNYWNFKTNDREKIPENI